MIIEKIVLPFMHTNPNFKLHQDNDVKHCSMICTQALNAYNIDWVDSLKNKLTTKLFAVYLNPLIVGSITPIVS